MEQGELGIEADLAETDRLDFTNGLWIFTGNVKVKTATAVLYSDEARLTFKDHQLADAALSGSPARFEQQVPDSGKINTGEASQIFYQLASQTLRLQKSARFSDGANDISGDQIVYDLGARRLTADSGESGPVKILIESPNQLKEELKSP
jgi:lipopolysaccharide transport protein LptA